MARSKELSVAYRVVPAWLVLKVGASIGVACGVRHVCEGDFEEACRICYTNSEDGSKRGFNGAAVSGLAE